MRLAIVTAFAIAFACLGCAEVDREDLNILREELKQDITTTKTNLNTNIGNLRADVSKVSDSLGYIEGIQVAVSKLTDAHRDNPDDFHTQKRFEDSIRALSDNVDRRFKPIEEKLAMDPLVEYIPDRVIITDIAVTNEYDSIFGPRLEIEVHVYDSNDTFLACSGQINGLEHVDRSDVRYAVNGFFSKPDGTYLTYSDIEDKEIFLAVIEDDEDPCPDPSEGIGFSLLFPIGNKDDHVGTSELFLGSDIAGTKTMRFGNVRVLKMTFALTWRVPTEDDET